MQGGPAKGGGDDLTEGVTRELAFEEYAGGWRQLSRNALGTVIPNAHKGRE